jgi:hypothetical protein
VVVRLVQVSTQGTLAWAVRVTGPHEQTVRAATAARGAVYVVGSARGPTTFHHSSSSSSSSSSGSTPITMDVTGVRGATRTKGFVARVSAHGHVEWVRTLGPGQLQRHARGVGDDHLTTVAVHPTVPHVFVGGTFAGPGQLQGGQLLNRGANAVVRAFRTRLRGAAVGAAHLP